MSVMDTRLTKCGGAGRGAGGGGGGGEGRTKKHDGGIEEQPAGKSKRTQSFPVKSSLSLRNARVSVSEGSNDYLECYLSDITTRTSCRVWAQLKGR